ncbi:hypothetical protein EG328_002882 [Venturia inaequalis]|uniref:Glucose-methanol-choline oxidoreductase N-terminal domain-containing protein n=1 Tax=Venturia inaequalis TaxID=5025 RepID=A0A8H3Z0W9_VENIN|nr:hypothetical protein EG328_002882 [Venturia inaequalis]KAE9990249.1 hypothetical protein EG327_001632 [Venturia inaequalis]
MKTSFVTTLLVGVSSAWRFGSPLYSNNFGEYNVNATFDYVVVGGGTAGLAIAARLAENPTISVAVVEAGGFYESENSNKSIIPGYYNDAPISRNTNWAFTTEPEANLAYTTINYTRGRTLGGSSALNAMLYQRGSKGSYDLWANHVGDESWTFENLLPYFHKSINYTEPNATLRPSNASIPAPNATAFQNSTSGPQHVSFPNTPMPFSSWGALGMGAVGIPEITDFSSGLLLGRQYCPLNIRPDDATRSSSEAGYLQWAFGRNEVNPNLIVYTHTMAKRIQFDQNKTATSVIVQSGLSNSMSFTYRLSARREIIVSAGAFQSPQLLMVSGVGPASQLQPHNIPIVADRPGVGQNMWDHVIWSVSHEINVESFSVIHQPERLLGQQLSYIKNQTGYYGNMGSDYLGWEKVPTQYFQNLSATAQSDIKTFPSDWPDFEYVMSSNPSRSASGQLNYVGVISPALLSPISRGNITISSNDTSDPPIINLGWLTSQTDVDQSIISFKRCREMWSTPVMQNVTKGPEIMPGASVATDTEIEAFLRKTARTVYHASCTCKMGKLNDPMAVVDSQARVIGVQNLRVVDASAFPLLPPGHPTSTIYAFAEKIAADILTGLMSV